MIQSLTHIPYPPSMHLTTCAGKLPARYQLILNDKDSPPVACSSSAGSPQALQEAPGLLLLLLGGVQHQGAWHGKHWPLAGEELRSRIHPAACMIKKQSNSLTGKAQYTKTYIASSMLAGGCMPTIICHVSVNSRLCSGSVQLTRCWQPGMPTSARG